MTKRTGMLAGCVCCEPRVPFAAAPVTRRGLLGGGAATLATFAATPTTAQAPAKPRRIDVHHHIIPPVQREALTARGSRP